MTLRKMYYLYPRPEEMPEKWPALYLCISVTAIFTHFNRDLPQISLSYAGNPKDFANNLCQDEKSTRYAMRPAGHLGRHCFETFATSERRVDAITLRSNCILWIINLVFPWVTFAVMCTSMTSGITMFWFTISFNANSFIMQMFCGKRAVISGQHLQCNLPVNTTF